MPRRHQARHPLQSIPRLFRIGLDGQTYVPCCLYHQNLRASCRVFCLKAQKNHLFPSSKIFSILISSDPESANNLSKKLAIIPAISGLLKFEIVATGVNEKNEPYTWRTTPSGSFNIIESLSGNGVIEPSIDWTTSFITQINEKVGQAQAASQEALNAAEQAESSANLAVAFCYE